MAINSYGVCGGAGLGPSSQFLALPYRNYRDQSVTSVTTAGQWLEEFVDALGIEFDIRDRLFIGTAFNGDTPARQQILDPTFTPSYGPFDYLATALTPPNKAGVKDTMLDVLLFIAGIPWPVPTAFTTAQKQQLVQVGWTALINKGNRRQVVNLASKVTDGVIYGWTNPPYLFSLILPDGQQLPGIGPWVQAAGTIYGNSAAIPPVAMPGTATFTNGSAAVTGSSTTFTKNFATGSRISPDGFDWYVVQSVTDNTHLTLTKNFGGSTVGASPYYTGAAAISRPQYFSAVRNVVSRVAPAWAQLGVGYSQFRAGFSAAGETVFASGARLGVFADENMSVWSNGAINAANWVTVGTTSVISPNHNDAFINTEFSGTAFQINMVGATNGTLAGAYEQTSYVNNRVTHRFEIDYSYQNPPNVATLTAQIIDTTNSGTYYYNPTKQSWSKTTYSIPLPPSPLITVTGTVSVTNGSGTVTGSGTHFTTQFRQGQQFSVDKTTYYTIKSITTDTSLTLTANFSGTTASAATAYTFQRTRYGADVVWQRRDVGYPLTGKITLSAGSATVIGSGTHFTTELAVGDVISTDQQRWYTVSAIASDTSLTITFNALASASAVAGYRSYYVATNSAQIKFQVICDGTATTQQNYFVYRCSLAEKFDAAGDAQSFGERTLWLPLIDSVGWSLASGLGSGANFVEPANADRSAFSFAATSGALAFPYHPAISGRGFMAGYNQIAMYLINSNKFTASGWTLTSATATANSVISPLIGETSPSATKITASATNASVGQANVVTPTSRTYVGGVWAKKLTADAGNQSGTATFTSGSTTVTGVSTSFPTDGSWTGIQIKTAGGNVYTIASVASATSLTLATAPTTTETGVTFQVSDISISLISTSTKVYPFFLKQSQGWQLLTFQNAAFGSSDLAAMTYQINIGMASSTTQMALSCAYIYDVTGNAAIQYPPVVVTNAASAIVSVVADQPATNAGALTDIRTQRTMVSVVRGTLNLTVVPAYDGTSQPNGVIFDCGQDATHNRVLLQVSSGALQLVRYDNAALTHTASITLSNNSFPSTAGTMTWQRDVPITIRCIWDSNTTYLTAGNASASHGVNLNWSASDASVGSIMIGADIFTHNPFTGIITGVECDQVGAPVS